MTDRINQDKLVLLPVQIDKMPMPATLKDTFYLAVTRDYHEGASRKLVGIDIDGVTRPLLDGSRQ